MSTWVETVDPEDVDLETIPANKNVIKVNDVNDNDDDKTAIEAINNSTNTAARGLAVTGQAEVRIGDTVEEFALIALKAYNANGHANARALKAVGKSEIDGDLIVTGDADVDGALTVGPGNGAGNIEAEGTVQTPRDLEIGTGTVAATTATIKIGRAGRVVEIVNDLDVGGDASVVGTLMIGPGDAAAVIDAKGDEDLEIGGQGGTNDVKLGQAGNIVSILGKLMMNGNELWLDGTGSNKVVNNAVGHVPPNPSIDVYIGGNVVAWFDVNGVH